MLDTSTTPFAVRAGAGAVTDPRHVTPVRVWLAVIALLVFAMVIVGGATRLTDSGLSIVEWRPVTGAIPPLSDAAWLVEFEKYRQIPEYQLVNKGMSLAEFKFIYWWEWGHRLLGRLVGVVFLVPFLIFWLRGWFTRPYTLKLVGLFALGGLQGAIGWWMVASGLVNRVDVSQYRLAVHLTVACLILALAVWLFLDLGRRPARAAGGRAGAAAILVLLFAQIFMGGLVAGLDAGMAFNTWPLIDGRLVPDAAGLYPASPAWRNHFETALTVQWQHRMVAYGLAALVLWYWLAMRRHAGTEAARNAMALLAVTLAQVALGIVTLVLEVPMWAGLAHQGLAVALLAVAVRQLCLCGPSAAVPARVR